MDKPNQQLRLGYFFYPSLYSLLIANLMLRFYDIPVKAFIISTAEGYKQGKALPFYRVAFDTIRSSGMRYALYELAFSLLGMAMKFGLDLLCYLGLIQNRLYSFSELAKRYSVKIHRTAYFSSQPTLDWLAAQPIDAGLSAFNNQIFHAPILAYFDSKPFLNLHPGLLPNFKGVEPIVPLFLNQQTCAGVSLHEIARKIDDGRVVLQHRFDIEKQDTVFSLNRKSWQYGLALFHHWISHAGQVLKTPDLDASNTAWDYFTFPNKTSIGRLFGMNRYLFRWKEVYSLLTIDLKTQHEFDRQVAHAQTDKHDPAEASGNTKTGSILTATGSTTGVQSHPNQT